MDMAVRTPHALSLPLFDLLQQADSKETLEDTLTRLHEGIKHLSIENHVAPVLSFDEDREIVNVEPKDAFGAAICVELRERIAFPPCPPDMCEPVPSKTGASSGCRWCGKTVHLN